ncbi:uncharacterized protein BKA78DRAFT_63662 [Phyllosticta capitalensis]|uniref:uncharacterized protein n=1 Tax=Phyllosticta capitalensis TaxID=121624 RepID=UPI003132271D
MRGEQRMIRRWWSIDNDIRRRPSTLNRRKRQDETCEDGEAVAPCSDRAAPQPRPREEPVGPLGYGVASIPSNDAVQRGGPGRGLLMGGWLAGCCAALRARGRACVAYVRAVVCRACVRSFLFRCGAEWSVCAVVRRGVLERREESSCMSRGGGGSKREKVFEWSWIVMSVVRPMKKKAPVGLPAPRLLQRKETRK